MISKYGRKCDTLYHKGGTNSTKILHDSEYGDYLSAFAPIKNNGKVIGILGVDIDAKKVGLIQQKVVKE